MGRDPRLQRPRAARSTVSRQPLRGLPILAATLATVLATDGVGLACSCAEYLTDPVQALRKSAPVFAGEVVSVEEIKLPVVVYTRGPDGRLVPSQSMDRKAIVTLRAIKEWKGDGAREYVILAGPPPASPLPPGMIVADCEEHLEVGKRYLVFAGGHYPEANPCAPTGELQAKGKEATALDRHARKAVKARTAR
jgi:hypothetical protein